MEEGAKCSIRYENRLLNFSSKKKTDASFGWILTPIPVKRLYFAYIFHTNSILRFFTKLIGVTIFLSLLSAKRPAFIHNSNMKLYSYCLHDPICSADFFFFFCVLSLYFILLLFCSIRFQPNNACIYVNKLCALLAHASVKSVQR